MKTSLGFVVHSFCRWPFYLQRQQRKVVAPAATAADAASAVSNTTAANDAAAATVSITAAAAAVLTTASAIASATPMALRELSRPPLARAPERSLRSILLRQIGVPRADHVDDVAPVPGLHRLRGLLGVCVLIGQGGDKAGMYHGIRDLAHFSPFYPAAEVF